MTEINTEQAEHYIRPVRARARELIHLYVYFINPLIIKYLTKDSLTFCKNIKLFLISIILLEHCNKNMIQ